MDVIGPWLCTLNSCVVCCIVYLSVSFDRCLLLFFVLILVLIMMRALRPASSQIDPATGHFVS